MNHVVVPSPRQLERQAHSGSVIARLVARRAAVQGTLWGVVFGIVVVSSVSGFVSAYPTAADRALIKTSLSSNAGAQAILGPTRSIDTVAGFTAWRALGTVILIGAVWGILASTKFMRGEEDAGRWELLLAGRTTRLGAAAQAVVGLGVGLAAMFAATAAIVVVEGQTSDAGFAASASLFFALALVSSAALFLAIGALASQVAPTRRQAAGLAGVVLGVSFVLRMVAATSSGLHWLRWASPLGWIDSLHALTGSAPLALVPLVLTIVVVVAVTLHLAGARDLGASLLDDPDTASARTALLNTPTELAVRLSRGVAVGWLVGIGSLALILGLVAKAAAKSLTGSANIRQLLERLGGHRSGAESYLGFSFLVIATLVALVAASHVVATRDEEGDGRVENLLVCAVHRAHWMAGRLLVSGATVVGCGITAGVLAWIGAASQDSGVPLDRMMAAGVNVVPPAVLVLGIGTLVHGFRPRAAGVVAYGLIAWSFLVELVGALLKANHWLLDTSVLHHMKPVPAADLDWTAALVLIVIGAGFGLAGVTGFARRDLVSA